MSALTSPSGPPTDKERRLASDAGRRLAPQVVDTATAGDATARIVVQLKGREAGEPIEIPLSALNMLRVILAEMARGNAVQLRPVHDELTSQQAADSLHVSRPYLIKLLNEGVIAHRKVGRHRRVRFDDLMAYKRLAGDARSAALDELATQAQELGMGY